MLTIYSFRHIIPTVLLFLLMLIAPALAEPNFSESIPEDQNIALEQQVNELLSAGEYTKALIAYKISARKFSQDRTLRSRFAELNQVVKYRDSIKQDIADQQWLSCSTFLRSFYYRKALFNDALENDQLAYQKNSSPEYADKLLETMVLLNMDDQAREFNASLEERSLRSKTLALLLIARAGKPTEALSQAQNLITEPEKSPLSVFDLARIAKIAQNKDKWINELIFAFRYLPQEEQPALKQMALFTREFTDVKNEELFQQILLTPTRVEAECTHGCIDCDKCPKKQIIGF